MSSTSTASSSPSWRMISGLMSSKNSSLSSSTITARRRMPTWGAARPAPVVKVNNRFRYRVFWVGRNDHTTRELIAYYLRAFHQKKENRGMNLFIDCNAEEK